MRSRIGTALLGLFVALAAAKGFTLEEATIADIQAAMRAGELSCRQLVQGYLKRIEAFDKRGPALNSLITINPNALVRAQELDRKFAAGGLTGPLHCIPVIVKDNFNTYDMPTSAGSQALAESRPQKDAFQIQKLRNAGALILAKANLSEFAVSGQETLSSRLPGYTKNPYAVDRVTAGSSGGTAAAIAASFGAVGLGSDTENSIRGPASHTSLVGLRPTMGLTSRAGIVPLDLDRDIGGPMARTVADAAAVLDVIAGPDPDDPVTESSRGRIPDGGYSKAIGSSDLQGTRIGVLRFTVETKTTDPGIVRLFERALADLKGRGATLIEAISIPEAERSNPASAALRKGESMVWSRCSPLKFQLRDYLASLGPDAPAHSLEEILASRQFHPSIGAYLQRAAGVPRPPSDDPDCEPVREETRVLRGAMLRIFGERRLDAIVYPSWSNPPRLIGDQNSPSGMNSGLIAPPAGLPAITVPMGYVDGALPAGLELLGAPWSEPMLLRIAASYEQVTRHRKSPGATPSLGPADSR